MWRCVAALLLALVLAAPALADDPPKPPYPAIWGRELPGVALLFAPLGGDIAIFTSAPPAPGKIAEGAFARDAFFGGGSTRSSLAEFEARYHDAAESPRALGTFSQTQRIGFADGSTIAVEALLRQRDEDWTCDIPAPAMVKRDAKGKVLWRKVIARLLEHPLQARSDQNCRDASQLFTRRVEFWSLVYHELYGLEDGTFLAWFNGVADRDDNLVDPVAAGADNRRFAIRFDAELRSPFLATLPEIVAVDAATLTAAIADAVKHPGTMPGENRSRFHERVDAALRKIKDARGGRG